ncbi:MAG TPA: nitroreductase family deazaflavin-dependent oxidoreductase [Chloroflexota bacterium]|jgi:deazaflavin-dependent oxidoreductase (nitroreductase family)|nr:nitroreductase family deazaflavin-dependent oxidoreductase [Chloroflexota bacterium]
MSIANAAVAPARRQGAPRSAARLFNPLILSLAGTRLLPLYAVITHRGRRTGKAFRTPVVARPTGDGFIVPMPWGERTDWYRNVRAAGGCVIRWKGRDYEVVQPEVVDVAAAAGAGFGALERLIIDRFKITQYLRLRHRGEAGDRPALHGATSGGAAPTGRHQAA